MLAERLKLFRQARGLSLEELSGRIDRVVSKQAISKYERGDDIPSAKVLLSLAKALNVTTDNLLADPVVRTEPLFFRKKSRLGAKELERLTSLLSCHLEDAVRVHQLIAPDRCFDVPVRSIEVSNLDEAEEAAIKMRDSWGLGDDPIGSVVDAVEDRGISVCMVDAEGEFDGLSAVAKNDKGSACGAAVLCREGLTRERQRLNVAHELAHVVLSPTEELDEEASAWRFAGAFLAPKAKLFSDVGEFRHSVSLEELKLLKSRYGMSIQALVIRLKDIGVFSEATTRQAFIAFNQMNMRRHEPGDTTDIEQPSLFRRSVLRAVSEGLLSAKEATEYLGEEVKAPERKRNQFIRLLASLPPDERQPYLDAIEPDEYRDDEWLDADLGGR